MKLTEKQKRVISSIQLQANAPIAQSAEETGYKPHVVRYVLDSLKNQGLITPYASIDPTCLGLQYISTYFSFLCDNEQERGKLIDFIKKSPKVALAREVIGEYQFNAMLRVNNSGEVNDFFIQISKTCQGHFLHKAVATWLRWFRFRDKYLSAHPCNVDCTHFGEELPKASNFTLNKADLSILQHLANSAFPSTQHLARILSIPRTTVESRIKRLEALKIINGYRYHLRWAKCGIHSCRVLVTVRNPKDNLSDALFRFALSHPNIKSFAQCIGNWEYELAIRSEQFNEIPRIVQSIYSRFKHEIASLNLLTIAGGFFKFSALPFK